MDCWLFLLICLAVTFSPGPAMLLAIKNSASFGFWQSLRGIAGNIAAVMTLASLSAAGLGWELLFWLLIYCLACGIFIGFGLSLILVNKS